MSDESLTEGKAPPVLREIDLSDYLEYLRSAETKQYSMSDNDSQFATQYLMNVRGYRGRSTVENDDDDDLQSSGTHTIDSDHDDHDDQLYRQLEFARQSLMNGDSDDDDDNPNIRASVDDDGQLSDSSHLFASREESRLTITEPKEKPKAKSRMIESPVSRIGSDGKLIDKFSSSSRTKSSSDKDKSSTTSDKRVTHKGYKVREQAVSHSLIPHHVNSKASITTSLGSKGSSIKQQKSKVRTQRKGRLSEAFSQKSEESTEVSPDTMSLASTSTTDASDLLMGSEELIKRYQMLDSLKGLPNLSDVSETSIKSDTESVKSKPKTRKAADFQRDKRRSTSTSTGIDDEQTEDLKRVSPTYSTRSYRSYLTLSGLSDSDSELFALSKNDDSDVDVSQRMVTIRIRSSKETIMGIDQVDAKAQHVACVKACYELVNELIGKAVYATEQWTVQLPRKLNKEKLIATIIDLVTECEVERLYKKRLELIIGEHLARKKYFSMVTTSKQFDAHNYERFQTALIEYDKLLEVEQLTTANAANYIRELNQELAAKRVYSAQKVTKLQESLRQVLLMNDNHDHLQKLIEAFITEMHAYRNQLSAVRLELFNAQHKVADIANKSERLDDLGHGFRMREYMTEQAETLALSAKIHERNAELARLSTTINYNIHALAHLKAKDTMNSLTCDAMKAKLAVCEKRNKYYRGLIYKGKLKHNKYMREFAKLRQGESLIHFPLLMHDYDQTMDVLKLKREFVQKLRNEHRRLLMRIRQAESMLSVSTPSKVHKNSLSAEQKDPLTELRLRAVPINI